MTTDNARGQLGERFVACWKKLNEFSVNENLNPLVAHFSTGEKTEYGGDVWRPIVQATDPSLLEPLYARLPARFPPFYERLVLRYRWPEVDLGPYRLLGWD